MSSAPVQHLTASATQRPAYVSALEASYGAPSEAGFGSSVFFVPGPMDRDLEEVAKHYYQHFVGKQRWDPSAAERWLGQWREVYRRTPGATSPGICAELRTLDDREARMQGDLILNVGENPEAARKALEQAYDSSEVADLRMYMIGDGEAMSGMMLIGVRKSGEATVLIVLMD